MGKAFFITGNDTGIGKSFFGASLAFALREKGLKVGVFKPVESGCKKLEGDIVPNDAALLQKASGTEQSLEQICLYRFTEEISPSLAAQANDVAVDFSRIVDSFEKICQEHDVTLVEGAGGVFSPLYQTVTVMELMRRLNLPVISVIGSRLGSINQTLMTENAILAESLGLVGHVLNNFHGTEDAAACSNPDAIKALVRRPILGVLPRVKTPWLEAATFEDNFDLASLELGI